MHRDRVQHDYLTQCEVASRSIIIMATGKDTAANATPSVATAAKHGLKGFQTRKIVAAIKQAAEASALMEEQSELRAKQAFTVCTIAQSIRKQNKLLDRQAWSDSWRASIKGILPELYAAKVPWVERTDPKDNTKSTTYKLTSYGQNISSNANQVGQFDIDAKMCGSLQSIRRAIKKIKAREASEVVAAEEAKDPNLATLRALLQDFDDGVVILRGLIVEAASIPAFELECVALLERIELNQPVATEDEEEEESDDTEESEDDAEQGDALTEEEMEELASRSQEHAAAA